MNLLFDSTEHLAFFTPYWMERLCNTPLLLMHKYAIYQSWNTCDRTGCIFNALNIQHNNQKSFDDLFYIVLWSASHIFSGVIKTNNSFNMDSYFFVMIFRLNYSLFDNFPFLIQLNMLSWFQIRLLELLLKKAHQTNAIQLEFDSLPACIQLELLSVNITHHPYNKQRSTKTKTVRRIISE